MPRRTGKESTAFLISFFRLVILVVLIDQISKVWILGQLSLSESIPIIPGFFHLTLAENRGIAFGFFHKGPLLLFLLITLSLIVLGYGIRWARHWPSPAWQAYALILGGALGNWIDRLRLGYVVDFLDFRIWPVFNIADSCITLGACLYLFSHFLKNRQSS